MEWETRQRGRTSTSACWHLMSGSRPTHGATSTCSPCPGRHRDLRYFVLNGTDHRAHAEQDQAIAWRNQHAKPKHNFAGKSEIGRPNYLPYAVSCGTRSRIVLQDLNLSPNQMDLGRRQI